MCRAEIPACFEPKFYYLNVDMKYRSLMKRSFPQEYEQHIQSQMKRLPPNEGFKFELEYLSYYTGYENPEKVTDYEQVTNRSEWVFSIRTKNPAMRHLISQFLTAVEFTNAQNGHSSRVKAPKDSKVSVSGG